jgi:hypothetical protein
MGEHRSNPRAIAAAEAGPKFGESYSVRHNAVLELNKEKVAELTVLLDAAKERGEDPRFAIPKWNPTDNPEFFDYVVYNEPMLGRTSALAIDPRKVPYATMRWSEHLRIPLVELRKRADETFATAEARGAQH